MPIELAILLFVFVFLWMGIGAAVDDAWEGLKATTGIFFVVGIFIGGLLGIGMLYGRI